MVTNFSLALSSTAKRLSDVYGGTAGAQPDAAKDIPYRQLIFTATGAIATIGGVGVTSATGVVLQTGTQPLSVGPFNTGPVKLSDFYAVGSGATIGIMGVPF